MSNDGPYYVQCMSGNLSHILEAVPGSELEAKCIARAEAGMLDALCLSTEECPGCVEDARENALRYSFLGCPMEDSSGNCADNCSCRQPITDSPYEYQVRGISIIA